MTSRITTIKGCRIIPFPLGVHSANHLFYIKQQQNSSSASSSSSASDSTKGRTLAVYNVDFGPSISVTDIGSLLRDVFGRFGDIEDVQVAAFTSLDKERLFEGDILMSAPKLSLQCSARYAHVIFARSTSVETALDASPAEYERNIAEVAPKWSLALQTKMKTGAEIMEGWVKKRPQLDTIKAELDSFMSKFEEEEGAAEEEDKAKANRPDVDGFMPVVSRKRKAERMEGGDISARSSKVQEGLGVKRRKKKDLELKNFYSFQMKQDKMGKIEEIRRRFEDDKARIAKMKQDRKFKPF